MGKRLSVLFFILAFSSTCFSQGCPVNIDFEKGDFSNWDCSIGTTSVTGTTNVITLNPSPPQPGRHEIMSVPGQKDPYGKFPTLCPYGGKYSVKLGNENTENQAEGISYTFQVPALQDTFSFTYFYAVVFQDPGHLTEEQPRFFVTAYDVITGALINCASYDYVATSDLPGFLKSTADPGVLYKNWSPVSIQFVNLNNRMVRLEFKTADCTKGGHFGYAYLDVGSGCKNILATAPYCIETNSVILNAPYGFKDYTWFNENYSTVIGSGQSLTLSPPPASDKIFHVDMEPYPGFGCRDTVDAVVTPLPVPDTPRGKYDYFYCQYDYPNEFEITGDPGNELWWYKTETGGVGSVNIPIVSTALPGIYYYYVSQKVLFGCESFRRKIKVTVTATPKPAFNINQTRQCQNVNDFAFTNTSTNLDNSSYVWEWGDGKVSTKENDKHTYDTYGSFTVKLKVLNPPVCAAELSRQVYVVPKPLAAFTYPPIICENQTPVIFNDISSVPLGLSNINKWWWQIDQQIVTSQFPPAFAANKELKVKFVVGTTEGCLSDTNSLTIPLKHLPVAAIDYSKNLCDNEMISFKANTTIPRGGPDETVVKWNWEIDNNLRTDANTLLFLNAGTRHAKLIATTNYGCFSKQTDSVFVINPKPHIRLDINDSCVFRNINYSGVDLSSSVNKWFWNFGNSLNEGAKIITRSYAVEGNNPVTVIGQTIHGCKDTIIRPFTIYDNKAFAGYDTLAAFTQPVQLNAHGGANVQYVWSPPTGLSNAHIENPIALLPYDQVYKLDAITDKGCDSHSDIFIKRWEGPELYIPTAFTPNADGLNDKLSVFPVGIKAFYFYAVYNRVGQRIFYSTDYLKKWDGTFNNLKCDVGNYVVVAKALDYNNKIMFRKINVVLIR